MITPRRPIPPALVADHYNELDRWYRLVWGEHVHHGLWLRGDESVEEATRNLIARVAGALHLESGSRVCDVGCGYGGTARVLAEDFDAKVTGVTLSETQYAEALRMTDGDTPTFLCRDFLDNDFEDGAFDAALAIESTEHFDDKRRLFSEVHRILTPGGRFAVCAWLATDDPSPRTLRHVLEPICYEGRLPGLGSEQDYRGLFRDAGFSALEFEELTPQVARTWPIIVGRVLRRLCWDVTAWRFLLSGPRNIAFAKTIVRIALAYRTGAMRYGIFTARTSDE